LALRALAKRDTVTSVGCQIGVGKESDVYVVCGNDNIQRVLKLQRLGRTSFRRVKEKRDYLRHRNSSSWLYLSRLAAQREWAFLNVLWNNGFPVPEPIDCSRHCVVMALVDAHPLSQVHDVSDAGRLYSTLMDLIVRLANVGLVHGDFNEFNILLKANDEPILIDFPQMVSTSHHNAEMYFNRDVECIRLFFKKRFNYISKLFPKFREDTERGISLDVEVMASGYSKSKVVQMVNYGKNDGEIERGVVGTYEFEECDDESEFGGSDYEGENEGADDDYLEEIESDLKGLNVNGEFNDVKGFKKKLNENGELGEIEKDKHSLVISNEKLGNPEIQDNIDNSDSESESSFTEPNKNKSIRPFKAEKKSPDADLIRDKVRKKLNEFKNVAGGKGRNKVKTKMKKEINAQLRCG
jgi:RIO kinase 2